LKRSKTTKAPSDIASIFKLVKNSVKEKTEKSRAGVMLGLADLPGRRGAYHTVSSSLIVLNRKLLRDLVYAKASKEELEGYIFYTLLHEYLHTLGYLDDVEVDTLVKDILRSKLGKQHPATRIATYGVRSVFPSLRLRYSNSRFARSSVEDIEIVKTGDEEIPTYIV